MTHRPKRPADANQLAKSIVELATGEAEDAPEREKDAARQKGGKRGGAARADKLTPDERSDIARKAAAARWNKPQA